MKIVSQAKKILDKLKKENKVRIVEMTPEQISEWQEQMLKIKEESRIKQNNSWQSSKDFWLD